MKNEDYSAVWNGLLSKSMHLSQNLDENFSLTDLVEHLQTIEELLKDRCEPSSDFGLYVFYHFAQSIKGNLEVLYKNNIPRRSIK